MATTLRFITDVVGASVEYKAKHIYTLADDAEATRLVAAGFAYVDPIDLSTVYSSALNSAGYTSLGVEPSGYQQVGVSGAYYKVDANHFTILTPGAVQHLVKVVLVDIFPRY